MSDPRTGSQAPLKERARTALLRLPALNSRAVFAIAYAGSAGVQKGLGLLLFLWLAHSLPVDAYAQFGLFYALQTGITAFAIAGIIESVVGMLKDRPSGEARTSLFSAANTVFVLLAVLSTALTVLGYRLIVSSTPASWTELLLVAATGIITAFFTLQALLTRLEEKHLASLCLNSLPALAGLLAGFLAFAAMRTVPAFFAGTALGLLLSLLALAWKKVPSYGFARRSGDVRLILARIAPFILIVLLGWLSGYGNTYLVQYFFNPNDVARFTFAYSISSIMQLVATSLNQVWSPRFFQLVHELTISEVEARNQHFYRLQGLALGLFGGAVLVILPLLMQAVGPSLRPYQHLELEMFFLFAAYAVSIPWWHIQNYYLVHGKGHQLMNITLATSIAGLIAWAGLMATLGVLGVYAGFFAMMLLRSIGVFLHARQLWQVRLLWQGPALATLMLGGCTLIASQLGHAP